MITRTIPKLPDLLQESDDREILTTCCWALAFCTDGESDRIQVMIDSGLLPRCIELLSDRLP